MSDFSLADLLASTGKRMRQDLHERLTAHPGELGAGREKIIRDFLSAYLPKRFEISTGFVFDCHGSVSKQLDIVISDAMVCPRFETAGGIRFHPCESVVAVAQVKSSITSRDELLGALENLESVKALDRSANNTAIDADRNEMIDHRLDHLHQIFTFLFIVGPTLSPETLVTETMGFILKRSAHLWPNLILALDKYLVTYRCVDGICPNPMHARGIALQPHGESDELLMRLYTLLGRAIEVTRVSGLPYWQYLHEAATWNANVVYSATDDPPPLLKSLTWDLADGMTLPIIPDSPD
jgi:hypothetical protein